MKTGKTLHIVAAAIAIAAFLTSCQSTPDFITLRFSDEVTLLVRLRASSNATRPMRSIS